MKLIPPHDSWGVVTPRRWQADCLSVMLRHYQGEHPLSAVVRAVMGSGKSILMAQFLAHCVLEPHETIVITTSSIKLVDQLAETIRVRLDPHPVALTPRVGCYYTHGKDVLTPIVVTCIPSTRDLAKLLQSHGRHCALWVCDEVHKSECVTVHEAYNVLMPALSLGMTATPFRSEPEESLSLFQSLIYDYGPKEALADDPPPVVPWRIVPWGGAQTDDLDAACIEMTEFAIGPGMYNALSILDADLFVEKLNKASVPALAIHSNLSRDEITSRIDSLRTGGVRAIVHVNMLQEGVDFPWLRWLCMRRPVSSRVRFVQEIGRVLRYHVNEKTGEIKLEAVLYDPHDLFGQMSLSYEAVLGGEYLVVDEEEDEWKVRAKVLEQSVFEMMKHLMEVKAGKTPLSITPLGAYLRELAVAFETCGLLQRTIASRQWRTQPSTEKQHRAIGNLGWVLKRKVIPDIHRKALTTISDLGHAMTRGVASDLISVFISVADKKKWPVFKPLDKAADEALVKHNGKAAVAVAPALQNQLAFEEDGEL